MPRPCLRVAHGVCSLARQFGVGEALAANLRHEQGEAVRVRQFVVFRRTVVVTKHLFAEVLVKMKRLNRYIRSAQRPLQETPEVIESLSVNLSVYVFLRVVDNLVNKSLAEMVIPNSEVSVNLASTVNLMMHEENVRQNSERTRLLALPTRFEVPASDQDGQRARPGRGRL